MAQFNPNPRLDSARESAIQRRVSQEWPAAQASGNPTLYFKKQDWFPAGYNVQNGRLKYVQVHGSWASELVSKPQFMIPAVIGGGLAAGAASGGGLAASQIGDAFAGVVPGYAGGAGLTGAVTGATGATASVVKAAKDAAETTSNPGNTFAEIMKQIAPYLTAGLTGATALRGSDLQTDEQKQTQREMTEILAEQKRRMLGQSGLSDAVTQLAMGLLPTRYQR